MTNVNKMIDQRDSIMGSTHALLVANTYADIFGDAKLGNHLTDDGADIDFVSWANANAAHVRQFGEAMILLSRPEHTEARDRVCEGFAHVVRVRQQILEVLQMITVEQIDEYDKDDYTFVARQFS